MGRQILFHMLPEDRDAFLEFVQKRDPVIVTLRDDTNSAIVRPFNDFDERQRSTLCLWNQNLLPALERKFIPESDEGPYYRIDLFGLPVLEFETSFKVTWNHKPALGQGRLYGIFEGKPREFERWYEALVRWIRKSFCRDPVGFGGYIGPAAYEFYRNTGYLLPFFRPPKTKEWLKEIGEQH